MPWSQWSQWPQWNQRYSSQWSQWSQAMATVVTWYLSSLLGLSRSPTGTPSFYLVTQVVTVVRVITVAQFSQWSQVTRVVTVAQFSQLLQVVELAQFHYVRRSQWPQWSLCMWSVVTGGQSGSVCASLKIRNFLLRLTTHFFLLFFFCFTSFCFVFSSFRMSINSNSRRPITIYLNVWVGSWNLGQCSFLAGDADDSSGGNESITKVFF